MTQQEQEVQRANVAIVRCLAGILLNHELYVEGLTTKLFIDMNETEYQEYLQFLETLQLQ